MIPDHGNGITAQGQEIQDLNADCLKSAWSCTVKAVCFYATYRVILFDSVFLCLTLIAIRHPIIQLSNLIKLGLHK